MVAKAAKTVKVVRTAKTVRVVKPAGGRTTGSAKPVPSFPRQQQRVVDPWAPQITKDFKETGVRTNRVPQHARPGEAALTIQRGGGTATKVGGAAAVRADRVAKKRGEAATTNSKIAKPQTPEKPLKFSKKDTVSIDAASIKAIAKLVKLQLEGKPITKRKQYPTRSSTIVRVPNEILELVKQQIAAYRSRKAEK